MTLEKKPFNLCKLIMVILLVLAAILATANMIIGTMGYDYHIETTNTYDEETEEWYEEDIEVGSGDLVFNELGLWDCIGYLQNVAPIILLLMLTVGGSQMRAVYPITIGLLAVYLLLAGIDEACTLYLDNMGNVMVTLSALLLAGLAIFSVSVYPYKKGLTIPFFVVATIMEILRLAQLWDGSKAQIDEGLSLYAAYPITLLFTYLTIYAAMLLYIFKLDKPKVNIFVLPADQALRLLYDRLANGEITQEEYAAQRAEIINRL